MARLYIASPASPAPPAPPAPPSPPVPLSSAFWWMLFSQNVIIQVLDNSTNRVTAISECLAEKNN